MIRAFYKFDVGYDRIGAFFTLFVQCKMKKCILIRGFLNKEKCFYWNNIKRLCI